MFTIDQFHVRFVAGTLVASVVQLVPLLDEYLMFTPVMLPWRVQLMAWVVPFRKSSPPFGRVTSMPPFTANGLSEVSLTATLSESRILTFRLVPIESGTVQEYGVEVALQLLTIGFVKFSPSVA